MAKIVDYGSLIHFRSKPPAAINYTIYPVAIFELPFLNIKEVLWAVVTTRQEIYGWNISWILILPRGISIETRKRHWLFNYNGR